MKIVLPERKESPQEYEERVARLKRMLKEDYDKDGLLAKIIVFMHISEKPLTVTGMQDVLIQYYQEDINRTKVFRAMDRLSKLNILHHATSGEILIMSESERDECHKKIIEEFRKFISKQPKHFQHNYNNINYFWLANGYGLKFLEWSTKIIGGTIEE
jgi:hypothetical protein